MPTLVGRDVCHEWPCGTDETGQGEYHASVHVRVPLRTVQVAAWDDLTGTVRGVIHWGDEKGYRNS